MRHLRPPRETFDRSMQVGYSMTLAEAFLFSPSASAASSGEALSASVLPNALEP